MNRSSAALATSFDRTAAWIEPVAWRRLHTWGSYWLWAQFVVAFGTRVPAMPAYSAFVALLLGVLALRLAPRLRARQSA